MKRMKPNTTQVHQILPNDQFGPWMYVDTRTGGVRKRWWTKARTPGTTRKSRMSGGSGFRNNWEG